MSIEGSGAYCAGMSTKNYNSFPEVAEVILSISGEAHVIRKYVPDIHHIVGCVYYVVLCCNVL